MLLNYFNSKTKRNIFATSKTRKNLAYNPNFEQIFINNYIYLDNYNFLNSRDSLQPNNKNEIFDRLK